LQDAKKEIKESIEALSKASIVELKSI